MDKSYAGGYMPVQTDGSVQFIMPLLGKTQGNTIRVVPELPSDGPFAPSNLQFDVHEQTYDVTQGQNNTGTSAGETGVWHAGDVMEVLVRGSIALPTNVSGVRGGKLYIRKSDGRLTATAGTSGSTVLLENVRIRQPRTSDSAFCEVIVNKRNII